MRGPEHYRAAEDALLSAGLRPSGDIEAVRFDLAKAQVHATLALAAATAGDTLRTEDPPWWVEEETSWQALLRSYPPEPDRARPKAPTPPLRPEDYGG